MLQNEESLHIYWEWEICAVFALNLRAYIATLFPVLKCQMDYQTTDGVAMLFRYVTSCVTKSHDSISIDSMYSYEIQGREAATLPNARISSRTRTVVSFLF